MNLVSMPIRVIAVFVVAAWTVEASESGVAKDALHKPAHPHLRRHKLRHDLHKRHTASLAASGWRWRWSAPGTVSRDPRAGDRSGDTGAADSRYHPLVDRALGTMAGDLRDLKGQRSHTEENRKEMASIRGQAMAHMNDAVSLQREEARAEAIERGEEKIMHKLAAEEKRLNTSHITLKSKLEVIMAPKIKGAEKRLAKHKKLLEKSAALAKAWKAQQEKYKSAALMTLKERREAKAQLKVAEEQYQLAKKAREDAQENYTDSRQNVNKEIQAFQYANTKYEGALTSEKAHEKAEKAQEKSVGKLDAILGMESQRIDEALVLGEKKLAKRMVKAKKVEEEAEVAATELKKRFKGWQTEEKNRAKEAAGKQADYETSLGKYVEKRANIYEKAQAKAGGRAESVSDWAWDDWAWKGRHNTAKGQQQPSESDHVVPHGEADVSPEEVHLDDDDSK